MTRDQEHAENQNNDVSTAYRDEEWHKQTTGKVSKYYHGYQRNDHESLSIYLQRLGTNYRLKNENSTRYDRAKEKALLPLAQVALKGETVFMRQFAKILTNGYCYCSDVIALSNGNFDQRLSLADFQSSGKERCTRCWFIAECIAKFGDRWSGVDSSDVKVWMGPLHITHMKDILWGTGSARVFRIQWLAPSSGQQDSPYSLIRKVVLEIYCDQDGFPLYPNMTHRQTRPIRPTAQECAAKIESWIEKCTDTHEFCNEALDTHFMPTRLIDIGNLKDHTGIRVVTQADIADKSARYVALSYCWGEKEQRRKEIPKTKKITIQDRLVNIPWDELTQTFQDAIDVTRELGLQYVWIDALCITQDDKDDFATEASQMALIYGEAYVVLAATNGPTSDAGLLHGRAEIHSVSKTDHQGRIVSIRVKEETEHADFTTGEPQNFTSTPLFARAWCFQERILARRVVHFARDELVFECKEKLWCECGLIEPEHPLYVNFKVRLAYSLCKDSLEARIRAWYNVLRPYTARSLSYESDRFPALSGIARVVARPGMGNYNAGLWSCDLPSALLWRVLRALPEKKGAVTRPSQYRAPTWSWAGVQAVVEGHVALLETIKAIARVIEVECLPATSDPYGEVAGGYIVLEAPAIDVRLQSLADGARLSDRQVHVYREGHEDDRVLCETDTTVDNMLLPFTLIGIERNTLGGDHNNPVACLILKREDHGDLFYRVGVMDCSGRWLNDCSTRIVRIV